MRSSSLLLGSLLSVAAAACLLAAPRVSADRGEEAAPDPWEAVRFLIGEWTGTASGQPGTGTTSRSYQLVLADRYLHERNTSTYPAKDGGGGSHVHEHWGFFSFDREANALRLRQFHQEGFVNSYLLSAAASGPAKLVFESEGFENFDDSWRARETYEVVSRDEFVEVFELAPPGKPFEVYSRTHFRRAR
jgi:hypothetical protein